MKKLYILFALPIIGFIVNFSVWFWETKIMTDVLNELEKQLPLSGIELSHSDVKYSSFRAWQVNGYIENLKICYGKDRKNIIEIPILKFNGKPFNNNIEFSFTDKIYRRSKTSEESYRIEYDEELSPKLNLNLDLSFSEFLSMIPKLERKPIYTFIKHLQFSSPAFKVLEEKSNSYYFSGKELFLDLISNRDDRSRRFDINCAVNDILFDRNYSPRNESQKAQNLLNTELGPISAVFQVSYKEQPSKKQIEYLEKLGNKDVKPVLDSYRIDLIDVHSKSSLFDIDIKGSVNKQPEDIMLPSFNIIIDIANYTNLFDHYVDITNLIIKDLTLNNSDFDLLIINEGKKEELKKILASFNPKDNTLSLEVARKNNEEITISGESLIPLLIRIEQIINNQTSDGKKALPIPEKTVRETPILHNNNAIKEVDKRL
jgi:hypothetical protein